MIKLKNVSKFYYSKGVIASGITRVNLDLDVGEFVVITGESGSGKSTLLNVISGLDTYEEGEMYIQGRETSHYTAADFENYRKQYIGNIFQSFNLVTSYTVYQNVALALEINGSSKEEIRRKVPAILERVGMAEFSRTKVSKLSGGQKQRVAIARALAKETKIIVADEPTGNLDSESAQGIVELLTELATDRLVIVVTHNFDQFKDYATRIIKMHDGRIVEDTGIKTANERAFSEAEAAREGQGGVPEKAGEDLPVSDKKIRFSDQIKLGVRNTFNIIPKFLLLLLVFLFIVSSVSSQYVTVKKMREATSDVGYNPYFMNYDVTRIVVERTDKKAFTQEDYDKISAIPDIKQIVKDDMVMDGSAYIENSRFSVYGYLMNLETIDPGQQFLAGGMPAPDDKKGCVVEVPSADYIGTDPEALVGRKYTVESDSGYRQKLTVTGIFVSDGEDSLGDSKLYVSDSALAKVRQYVNATYSTTTLTCAGEDYPCTGNTYDSMNAIIPNKNVPEGYILLPYEYNYYYDSGYATGNTVTFHVRNMFYKQDLDLVVSGTYYKDNFEYTTGQSVEKFDSLNGQLYINPKDYKTLFSRGNYQTTVYASSTRTIDQVKEDLEAAGYDAMTLRDHQQSWFDSEVLSILQVPFAVLVIVVVFFIAYFVIRLILRSRTGYFAILRMLGMERRQSKRIMDVEMVLVSTIAFILFLGFVLLNYYGVIKNAALLDMIMYMRIQDYVILAVVVLIMTLLISGRFTRSVFKRSAMDTYREEA